MPLPDVEATLQEIAYAYDTLKADGVGLMTSYGDMWLGNAAFRPVMEELNRRNAIVHVHPTAANCCKNLGYGVAAGSIEYGTDTTRAITGVAFSGDAARCPNIRFIWSHAGGTVPFLAGRIDGASNNAKDRMPRGFMYELKRLRDEPVSAEELENAKRAIIGSFALSLEQPNTLLQNIITQKLYNLPADYWDTYPQKVSAITVADVQNAAKKYIDLGHLQVVAVGDATKAREILAKYGKVEVYDAEGKPVGTPPGQNNK